MDRQRILLTGGAGFIGSHLSEALLHRNAQLTIVDNLDDFYSPALKKATLEEIRNLGDYEFYVVDICDTQSMRNVISQSRPDVVIHLAARAGVRPSIEQPSIYAKVNVSGTVNLLELCREVGIKKFVFGSSSSVYGATSKAPFSEDHVEGRPISPYAATKLSAELFCYTYAHLYGFPVICLRFFTVYGPRQRPDLAIHKFTAQLEAGKPILRGFQSGQFASRHARRIIATLGNGDGPQGYPRASTLAARRCSAYLGRDLQGRASVRLSSQSDSRRRTERICRLVPGFGRSSTRLAYGLEGSFKPEDP